MRPILFTCEMKLEKIFTGLFHKVDNIDIIHNYFTRLIMKTISAFKHQHILFYP